MNISKGEKLFFENKPSEAFPLLKEGAKQENPRDMALLSLIYNYGICEPRRNTRLRDKLESRILDMQEPLGIVLYGCAGKKAVSELSNAVENGDKLAKLVLGRHYLFRTRKNAEKGEEMLRELSDDGVSIASFGLSRYYERKKDKRFKEYGEKAFSQGCLEIAYYLSTVLKEEESAEWTERGANAGYAECIGKIGFYYREGCCGYEKSPEKAEKLYKKAMQLGSALAACYLGELYEENDDEKKAIEMYKKAVGIAVKYGERRLVADICEKLYELTEKED